MPSYRYQTLDGTTAELAPEAVAALSQTMRGEVLTNHDASEVAVSDTAYAGRDANFVMYVHGRWQTTDDDTEVRDWSRRVFHETTPFATGGGYVNFLTEDEGERTDSAYSQNLARLARLKQAVDPENLFRMNWNISPVKLVESA